MNNFEHLKTGDLFDKARYVYLTRLKRFTVFRKLREFIASPTGEFIQMIFLFVPCLIIVAIWMPILWWREKRDEKWIRNHMDKNWN